MSDFESCYFEQDGFIPPQDIEAEQSVLGAMLISADVIDNIACILKSSDFYRPTHGIIFDTILTLRNRNEPADALTVKNELEKIGKIDIIGGAPYLHTIISHVVTLTNVEYYARIIKEKSMLNKIINVGRRIEQLGCSVIDANIDDIIDKIQTEVFNLTTVNKSNDWVRVNKAFEETIREIEEKNCNHNNITGVPTGFVDLDDLTGGFTGGQMVIVAARPGIGKSTFGLDVCRNLSIKHKIPSAIFSFEMSRNEIVSRMISAECKINLSSLKKGTELKDEDWTRIAEIYSVIDDAPLFIDDSANLTMNEIKSKCRRLKKQEGIELVVIDYLQLMASNKRHVESRQQEVSEISRSIKVLAKELNIPIIAIAQLNRGAEQRVDKRPMMSDLRESGSLEQDADIIILLNRPSIYNENDRPGEADIIVAKHRNGETRTIPVAFQGHYSKFANMARR